MKIALAQINPTVGDIAGNGRLIEGVIAYEWDGHGALRRLRPLVEAVELVGLGAREMEGGEIETWCAREGDRRLRVTRFMVDAAEMADPDEP